MRGTGEGRERGKWQMCGRIDAGKGGIK